MIPVFTACPICPSTPVHRVHRQAYDFESTKRSNQDFIWSSLLRRLTIDTMPQLSDAELIGMLGNLRRKVATELRENEPLPRFAKCLACRTPQIHRVHGRLYRFTSIAQSDQEVLWADRVRGADPRLTETEVKELARRIRQDVSEEMDRQMHA